LWIYGQNRDHTQECWEAAEAQARSVVKTPYVSYIC